MFGGETFVAERDGKRLKPQLEAVKEIMLDGEWHTIYELSAELAAREIPASDPAVSARIRDLRKAKFGGYNVEREYVADGVWQYRVAA